MRYPRTPWPYSELYPRSMSRQNKLQQAVLPAEKEEFPASCQCFQAVSRDWEDQLQRLKSFLFDVFSSGSLEMMHPLRNEKKTSVQTSIGKAAPNLTADRDSTSSTRPNQNPSRDMERFRFQGVMCFESLNRTNYNRSNSIKHNKPNIKLCNSR